MPATLRITLTKRAMVQLHVSSLLELYEKDQSNWQQLAYWIHNNLNYSHLQVFLKLCAFNIGWHEQFAREIYIIYSPKAIYYEVIK